MNILRSVYNISPEFVKSAYRKVRSKVMPFPYTMGKEFAKACNELMESQWYSKERLEELQLRKLEVVIKHAYENVPYYRRIFDERDIIANASCPCRRGLPTNESIEGFHLGSQEEQSKG